MSTITGTVNQGVTLGTITNPPTYASPLTIASTGEILAGNAFGVTEPNGIIGTVINQGTIIAGKHGINLAKSGLGSGDGGYVNNQGFIQGGSGSSFYVGVYIRTNGTLTNTGTITGGSSDNGVRLSNGGTINNNAGGLIESADGVYMNGFGAAAIVNNAGLIVGTAAFNGYGVNISNFVNTGTGVNRVLNTGTIVATTGADISGAGGVVANYGAGNITGTAVFGVRLDNGGTVVNAGLIQGGAAAIYFGGPSRLTLENGYQLIGGVQGAGTASLTVDIANTAGAFAVTYSDLGLTGFQSVDVTFGAAGNETLVVSNNSGTFGAVISGFTAGGDIIDLAAIGTNGTLGPISNNTVTVTGSLGSVTLQLDATDSTNLTTASDGNTGTRVQIACFRRGTLILTDKGEVPVEELAIGDRVITLSGAAAPIKWIGRRAYDSRFVRNNPAVLPIRITAGALRDAGPARNLWLSPEHALYLSDVLIPARLLVDDVTITQEAVDALEYFHIELATHDVILAEGVPVESYVECDNRGMFHNSAEFAVLYPGSERTRAEFCAPRIDAGSPKLTEIRRMIAARRPHSRRVGAAA